MNIAFAHHLSPSYFGGGAIVYGETTRRKHTARNVWSNRSKGGVKLDIKWHSLPEVKIDWKLTNPHKKKVKWKREDDWD